MSRFEIVRSDAAQPWHARFVARNGRIIFSTENYTRRQGALNAITLLASVFGGFVYEPGGGVAVASPNVGDVEVRDVDERVGS